MFGIGLPEMLLILALALIVVGPDKLPEMARSIAKGIMELKKTANSIKDNLTEDGNPFDEIKPELKEAAQSIKTKLLEDDEKNWHDLQPGEGVNTSSSQGDGGEVIDVEPEGPNRDASSPQPAGQTDTTANKADSIKD